MATTNFYVGPNDGWVQIADAPKFVRVSGFPHTHQYYLYAGASAPASGAAVAAAQTVTFSVDVPIANETITVNGQVFTFKASRAAPFEVTIGANFTASATNFQAAVNSDSTYANATRSSGVVTLHAYVAGASGNALTLTEAATNVAAGGATFAGGVDVVEGVLVCHHPFKVNVTMTDKLFVRVPTFTSGGNKNNGKLRLDVFTIT